MASLPTTNRLTFQETRVLKFLCRGMTNKQIAREMNISPRTVEDHRQHVLAKRGVSNAVALVAKELGARIAELESQRGAA